MSRLPKVRITSSGAWRSPYTRRVAKSVSRSRTGIQRSAATAAASIERPRSVFSSPVGERPRPSTMSRYDAATIAARPAMVIVCTRRRSMRTATLSDAPSASESGTRMLVLSATARIGSGQVTSSCNTHAVNEIAAATTTPHAGHCSRARSCTDFAAPAARDVPDQPHHRVDGGDGQHRPERDARPVVHQEPRDDRAGRVARGRPQPPRPRAERTVGQSEHEVQADGREQRDTDRRAPRCRSRARCRWRRCDRRARHRAGARRRRWRPAP